MNQLKYTLDALFFFMLVVSVSLFGVNLIAKIDPNVIHAAETMDLAILGGYYAFFFKGLHKARNKLRYCKAHWILILLLILPFFPFARLVRLATAEKVIGIGLNTLWHIFDELKLL